MDDTGTAERARARAVGQPSSGPGGLSVHEKIDVCRGVFVALVVMAHGLEIAWGVHPGAGAGLTGRARDVVLSVFGIGTYYVMGFFVLSGYCIQLSVARSARRGGFPVRSYALARATRVLPIYYLALIVAVAVEWAMAGARPREWPNGINAGAFLAQIVMVQYLAETFGSFASSWSMTHEVFYYALYGLLAYLAAGRPVVAAWAGLAFCAAVAAVSQTLYVTVAHSPYVYRPGILVGLGILWFLGALVAIHGDDLARRAWVRRLSRSWPAFLAAAIASRVFHLPPHGLYLFSGVAFALMILGFHGGGPVAAPASAGRWRRGAVSALGLSSYPMYLFHGPLMMLAGSWVLRSGAVSDWRLTWALLVGVGLSSGLALGWVLERPVMAWRASALRRWRKQEGSEGPDRVPSGHGVASRPVPSVAAARV